MGDTAKALSTQREVYRRSLGRWGRHNQYTLVEQLNLGSQEQEAGDLKAALVDLRSAENGLLALSGEHSPTVQAARVARARVLSDLGRSEEQTYELKTILRISHAVVCFNKKY